MSTNTCSRVMNHRQRLLIRAKILGVILLLAGAASHAQTMPVAGCITIPTNPAPNNPQAVARYRILQLVDFGFIQTCQFTNNPHIDQIVAAMTPYDLARLSALIEESKLYNSQPQHVIASAPGVPELLAAAAKHLSASSLVKIRAAFGGTDTDSAVNAYSSVAIKNSYFATTQSAPYVTSRAQVLSVGQKIQLNTAITVHGMVVPSPTLDMTVYEIYLDYVTAGWSSSAAMAAAGRFVTSNIGVAFTTGYVIGTGIYWLTDYIDPSVNIWIGDQIGSAVLWVCDGTGACIRQ